MSLEAAIHHHRLSIIAAVWPGAVLTGRSALSGGMPVDGWMFVTHPSPARKSDLALPGLTISPRDGPGPLSGDTSMPHGLFVAGPARRLVDNVDVAGRPPRGRPRRNGGTAIVEELIDDLARRGGAGAITRALSDLDDLAAQLPTAAVATVRQLLAAVLGTVTRAAQSPRLAARLAGEPFDEQRVALFRTLTTFLRTIAPVPRPATGPAARWTWLPFFESYFSNFIEGTEFGVDDAREITLHGVIPPGRSQDAHEVEATFEIVTNSRLRAAAPSDADDLMDLLREMHSMLLAAWPEKMPGEFKSEPNDAGGYSFVAPDLVTGTLRRGWDEVSTLVDPLHRAIGLMVVVTECHPFVDGNGRLARMVANGTLSSAGHVRFIIPTSYRSNYLAGLTALSSGNGQGQALLAVIDFAQRWTSLMDWSTFEAADAQLRDLGAYMDSGVAEYEGRGLRLPPPHSTIRLADVGDPGRPEARSGAIRPSAINGG